MATKPIFTLPPIASVAATLIARIDYRALGGALSPYATARYRMRFLAPWSTVDDPVEIVAPCIVGSLMPDDVARTCDGPGSGPGYASVRSLIENGLLACAPGEAGVWQRLQHTHDYGSTDVLRYMLVSYLPKEDIS